MLTFDMDFNSNSLEGKRAQYKKIFRTSYLCAFDYVVYMIDSDLHCHVGRRIPLGLRRFMSCITSNAADKINRPPLLLILNPEPKLTANSTSRGYRFERQIAKLYRLKEITLQGLGASTVNLSAYNWWRVRRLCLQGYKFVNVYEAFQIAPLRIAITEAKGSNQA
ncbi:unnamed protein product [Taenia asiatica]|uniref:FBD domain-containing protein n=1 Tax=Taenia asiatica TaxID=60517 RepID=A0A0R3VW50_TAEAS|nr:unnamed protein product [Taenia asiatica]